MTFRETFFFCSLNSKISLLFVLYALNIEDKCQLEAYMQSTNATNSYFGRLLSPITITVILNTTRYRKVHKVLQDRHKVPQGRHKVPQGRHKVLQGSR